MANGFQPQPNDFSSNSKSTHFLQASAGHMKLPMQYGTSENMSGSKSPKGCYLSGEHVVYYVDDWIPVQVNSELVLFPSKVFQHQDRPSKIGNQISANKQYVGYCTQSGMIYVYNRQTRQQCLLQGHQQRVTDMAFCGDQVSLLASASSDGHVFIWSITETSGEEDDQMTRGKILFSIQVLGEWESVHPLVCWRNQDLVVGIDKYVLTLSAEELKKIFVSSGFAFDNPMRCHVGNLTGGIKFAGVHDLEVTALTVISRRPTLIASASRDGTVRIWRDQEPVAVTRFVPYEGLPVYSVSCLSPFENDLHMILTSGGQENRELKLWVPFDTSCLVPAADIGKWKCIETVELKNSTDRRPCQLYFDRTLRDSGASLLLVGCTHDSSIYVVHVRFEAHSACMDYLSKFCVELPISNLTARSDSSGDGEEIVEIFCVHEESIHLYTLRRSQCTPPAHNGLSGPLSPTGSYRHLQELDLSDPLGFYSAESDNYCTLEMDDKAESLSSVSRASESLSSQSTSSGFGSWIEVPKLFDQLRDVGHVQTTDFVLQEQKTTGLTQLNSIATAPFSQQIPVLGLTRNDSWKGTKYSPVVSLGKLPETVAMTSFTTYTVPSLSIGHKSHEILTYDDKWNVKACKPTDFEGCNDGYPYALNALSSTIDNTNLCARNSVHSSVTDQSITGKINIALSSNFIDKKTVTMKNQKLHEMGETSELNNWNMSSEMLSLMNIERVRDKIVCSIMDTREIELPECSDWNYIHRRSTPANISLPYVLGKYAYDEQIDPFQVHGEEAVTSTAAVGSSFLGQSRKPVIFKAFETLDVCTSSVQESLCTLASMHAEFQKHISVAVEDTMCEESNRLDSCIAKHLERCLETYVDEIHLGFRKEASTRDDKQSVMHDMVLTVSKIGFPSTACENIVTEISSLGPAITRSILSHSDRMETAVVRNISQKQEIITDQLEKSIVVAAGNYIIEQLQANFWSQTLQESIGYYFQDKALPLYENLLRKVMERGETSSQENEHCYTSHIWGDLTSHFISVAFMLKETLTFAKMDLRSMEEELREGLRRVLYLMHCNENYVLKRFCNDRNDREVYDDHEGTFHTVYFSILVGEGMFEEAFIRILSLGDVNAVLWLCNQVDSSNIFASNPIPVSQLVLLSLLQQLACDLGREMAQKLLWIREAATAINPNDPTLSYYIRPVLEQVYLNLQRQLIQISPGSTLVNQMKVIMHVINSLLTSCR